MLLYIFETSIKNVEGLVVVVVVVVVIVVVIIVVVANPICVTTIVCPDDYSRRICHQQFAIYWCRHY